MEGLEYYIRSNTKLELVIHEMIDLVNRVENFHDQYEEYVEHADYVERSTLENFARGIVDDSTLSVKGMLPRIQNLIGGPAGNEFRVLGNRGLLELIASDMNVSNFTMRKYIRAELHHLRLFNSITIESFIHFKLKLISLLSICSPLKSLLFSERNLNSQSKK